MNDIQLTETITNRNLIHDGAIFRVERWDATLPNGAPAVREMVLHRGASAIVPLDDDNNIILVRQHRPAVGKLTWEIPAGKLDTADEDPLLCARRELSEETGMTADHWQKLTTMFTTPGFCSERIHIFLARGLHEGDSHPDDDEFVAVKRMPLSEAVRAVMQGEIQDSKTALAIMMAAALSFPSSDE